MVLSGEYKICDVFSPGEGQSGTALAIPLEEGIGSHTDYNATNRCLGWAIFVPGLSVRAQVPHVKRDLVSYLVSEERPG